MFIVEHIPSKESKKKQIETSNDGEKFDHPQETKMVDLIGSHYFYWQ